MVKTKSFKARFAFVLLVAMLAEVISSCGISPTNNVVNQDDVSVNNNEPNVRPKIPTHLKSDASGKKLEFQFTAAPTTKSLHVCMPNDACFPADKPEVKKFGNEDRALFAVIIDLPEPLISAKEIPVKIVIKDVNKTEDSRSIALVRN